MILEALAYAENGWPIFPCRSDKTPYTSHGVLDATTDLKQIEAWWAQWPKANIALDVGGAEMMVFDLDPGHSMKELDENVGPIPETGLTSKTPRGGEHLYFSIGDGETVKMSASQIAPNVDVRSFNSYVLLPPSQTADGGYEWTGRDSPAFRSDEMLRVCNSAKEKSKDRDTWLIEPDLPENTASAIEWLKTKAKIAVKGQGGDAMTYATAAHMKSFGMSQALAFDLMWEHWCPRCSPPWPVDMVENLQQKIVNAYQYNTSPPGNVTPAYQLAKTASLFKPVATLDDQGNAHQWTAGRFRVVDPVAMDEIKPPAWIIDDLLPEKAYAMMFGDRGTFKTFLALDMALSIASGGFALPETALWKDKIANPGPVLFAVGEGRGNIKKRVQAWENIHNAGETVHDFRLADPVPLVSEDINPFLDVVYAACPRKEGYQLVVLDTVGRAMQGTNENAQEHASNFTKMVQTIQYELNAAVLALHHSGHGDKDRSRGSSVFGADVDTEIRLNRIANENKVTITMTKQKDAPEWDRKEHVKLCETSISSEMRTLVAVKANENKFPKCDKHHPTKDDQEELMITINEVVIEYLTTNKTLALSQNALANAIAPDERIQIGSSQLRQKYLNNMREDMSQPATRYYNNRSKKWQYVED